MNTDRLQSQAAAAFVYLTTHAPLLVLSLDSHRRITEANAYALRVLGPHILGRPFHELAVEFTPIPDLHSDHDVNHEGHLLSIATTAGHPESFVFHFFALGQEMLALGSPNLAEKAKLEREVLAINRELADVSRQLHQANAELRERNQALQEALDNVKALRGLIPICASCKKIRDDGGYWRSVERYLVTHTDARLTHGLCPECAEAFLASVDDPTADRPAPPRNT